MRSDDEKSRSAHLLHDSGQHPGRYVLGRNAKYTPGWMGQDLARPVGRFDSEGFKEPRSRHELYSLFEDFVNEEE
jgi:hypothetical protein